MTCRTAFPRWAGSFALAMLAAHLPTSRASAGERPAWEDDLAVLLASLHAYVETEPCQGFYDYAAGAPVDLADLNPDNIEVPPTAWPRRGEEGLPSFCGALRRLETAAKETPMTERDRLKFLGALLEVFDRFPFLKFQAYYGSPDGRFHVKRFGHVTNNVFTVFMSRRLMILAVEIEARLEDREKAISLVSASLFPQTENGRAGAAVYQESTILVVGIGTQRDTDLGKFRKAKWGISQPGWKQVGGGTHRGGRYIYAHLPDWFLRETARFLAMYPKHLLAADDGVRNLKVISSHGLYYAGEMEDFARRYFPQWSRKRAWMGHLNGQSINIFGPGAHRARGLLSIRYRTESQRGDRPIELPYHKTLRVLCHEVMHPVHSGLFRARKDYQGRLDALLDLGVRERSCIQTICKGLEDYTATETAYDYFRKRPQETIAGFATVAFVDPICFLEWCVAIAQREQVVEPLNHTLLVLDLLSLDTNFRETNTSFIPTMQPTGGALRKIPFALQRDEKRRIVSLEVEGYRLELAYVKSGFAKVKAFTRPLEKKSAPPRGILPPG